MLCMPLKPPAAHMRSKPYYTSTLESGCWGEPYHIFGFCKPLLQAKIIDSFSIHLEQTAKTGVHVYNNQRRDMLI